MPGATWPNVRQREKPPSYKLCGFFWMMEMHHFTVPPLDRFFPVQDSLPKGSLHARQALHWSMPTDWFQPRIVPSRHILMNLAVTN
jgi:hypothetical protein